MKIIKRDGSEVPFNYEKIKSAIEAANAEVAEADRLSDTEVGFIVGRIERRCGELGRSVSVEEIQDMVIDELDGSEHYRLARHYSDYRLRHELLRKQNSTDAKAAIRERRLPFSTRLTNDVVALEMSAAEAEKLMKKLQGLLEPERPMDK